MSMHQGQIPCLFGRKGGIGGEKGGKGGVGGERYIRYSYSFILGIIVLLLLSSYSFETYIGLVLFSMSLAMAE